MRRHNQRGTKRSGVDPLSSALAECGRRLLGIAAFSGIINLLTLSGSLYMMQVYDRVIPGRSTATLASLSLLVTGAYVLQGTLDATRGRMLARLGALFDLQIQRQVYATLVSRPLAGDPMTTAHQPLRDLEQIRLFLSGMGPVALLDMPWSPLFLIFLFLFHPALGAVAVLGAAAIVALTLATERRSQTHARENAVWLARRQALAEATSRNAEAIRAMTLGPALADRWADLSSCALAEHLRGSDVYANFGAAGKSARSILQSGMLGVGALLVVSDHATGGVMMASSVMMGRALAPLEIALGTWRQFAAARSGLARLRQVLATTNDLARDEPDIGRPGRSFVATGVTVAAPGGTDIIVAEVSFALSAGSALAVLGPSGSGKSTLVRALVGAWPIAAGRIELDGVEQGAFACGELGRYLGYLPQDAALIIGTIAENIARFDQQASQAAIITAAKLAGAHDIIMRLPRQYQTSVGDGKGTLSAGQRQRIALARAVFGDPFLVVLDEPNANQDLEGVQILNQCIRVLRQRGSIVVVVSHRQAVMQAVDKILVMASGRAVAFGALGDVASTLQKATNKANTLHQAASAQRHTGA